MMKIMLLVIFIVLLFIWHDIPVGNVTLALLCAGFCLGFIFGDNDG